MRLSVAPVLTSTGATVDNKSAQLRVRYMTGYAAAFVSSLSATELMQ